MTTGNLPIQAFSATVTPEQGYKVTLNYGAGFDLTNPAVRVYQRSKQLTAGVPTLVVTGQQIVITYSVEQLTELRKAASVTQHHIYLPNMLYTARVGWEITVVNKFSDSVQVESLLGVTLGEDGETIAVSISGADVVAGLVAQAEAAAESAVADAEQTALDRVATEQARDEVVGIAARKIDNWQVDTKADADEFALTLDSSAFIEVLSDETQAGIRALYFWNTISLQEPLLL